MDELPPLLLPDVLHQALSQGADCALSTSGGVDSQALLRTFTQWHQAHRFPGQLYAIWADLGRAEWLETPAFVAKTCADLDLPLQVVRRTKGDLLDRFDERRRSLDEKGKTNVPHWPSVDQR